MKYKVIKIEEDIDFGCEERTEDSPVMAVVTLEDYDGEKSVIRYSDKELHDSDINEGDVVILNEKGELHKPITGDWTKDFASKDNDITEFSEMLHKIQMQKKRLRILFIGNSHTYFNYMPDLVANRFRKDGYDCEVTMIAHGGWYLDQHVKEQDVKFNIRFGHYDYVVLQEHSHPFGPVERFMNAAIALNKWIREAGSTPVIYMTWAKKDEEENQEGMINAHKKVAEEIDALLAPVGQYWWDYMRSNPDIDMYYEDGAHASFEGSDFAAKYIWNTIYMDLYQKEM